MPQFEVVVRRTETTAYLVTADTAEQAESLYGEATELASSYDSEEVVAVAPYTA